MPTGLKKLPRSFYLRPTILVAKDLLGKYLVRKTRGKRLAGKIVEVEAYCEGDPASHSYRGLTERNKLMFDEGGHLYVYFTYGMHFCANVVTRKEGIGEAVLIRAVEPMEGIWEMKKNRRLTTKHNPSRRKVGRGLMLRSRTDDYTNLANGPAKVCEAFGLTKSRNGADLTGNEIYISIGEFIPRSKIATSTRAGILKGQDKKWRFYIKKNKFVSRAKTRSHDRTLPYSAAAC